MKRLFFVVILAVMLIGLPLLGLSDSVISSDDIANADNEATSSVNKTSDSSASTTITITMTGIINE